MRLVFSNEREFVKHLINRCDNKENVIVGMGVQSPITSDGYTMEGIGGNNITGYFYENGHFYDHFIIKSNWARIEYAQSRIKEIRKVTDSLGYY